MKIILRKKLVARTGKVKSVDFHPIFNWILLGLYNGSISIYDYITQSSVQYIEVTNCAIRSAKFMSEKNYIICGADDKKIRIYNYNTMEKVKEYEAHQDFIRSIVCHLKLPMFLSSSDDNTIKLWDVENDFKLIRTYDEHKDFVMKLAINLKDYSMFASGSTDKKIKIWSFNVANSQLTIEGHAKGVNTIAFCPLNDKPYLASGSDDFQVKIWDYTNKHCIFTLVGHESNLSSVCFHPELPLLITVAEDQLCKFWNINTGKLEDTKIFGYDIVWDIGVQSDNNVVGFGCEEATLVVQMGNEEPLVTFNHSQSKIIYSMQNNLFSLNLKQVDHDTKDGEIITIPPKQLGSSEVFPNKLNYSPNGRYFSILSDQEFIVSTSGVYRASCVGNCSDISWNEGESFIIKDGSNVKIFNNLKEEKSFKPGFSFDGVFGGPLFAVKTDEAIFLYDVENTVFIRKIDVVPNKIIWNEKKSKMALICEDVMYILEVNYEKIEEYIEKIAEGEKGDVDGCEEAFGDSFDIDGKILNGFFIDDVFVFENSKNKISYTINDKVFNITTLSNRFFLLGYLESTNKLYLMNKNFQLISYSFPYNFIKYQMAILEKDFTQAEKLLPKIPESFNESVIKFLEKFELYDLCYKITKNPNQKFSLAIKLKKLSEAYEIAKNSKNSEKLKMVSDLAIELGEFNFAEKTMKEGNDWNGLLLYYSSIQNRKKLKEFADEAKKAGMFNVAFGSYFQLNNYDDCLNILLDSRRFPEAATFARTYIPSKVEDVIEVWNKQIEEEEKNNRTTMKIISPINEKNKENLLLSEKLCKEFYDGLNDEKNKLNEDNIKNFQEYDFYKEINEGNKKINLGEVIGAKIEIKNNDENTKKKEDKEEKKEENKEDKKDEKKGGKKPEEEEEEEGEDDEEGGEEDDNAEKK
jgi:coatomer subunit beta'